MAICLIPYLRSQQRARRRGMSVLAAGMGREAIATVQSTDDLAIVLMDIMMERFISKIGGPELLFQTVAEVLTEYSCFL
jgi:CheY-like chemotaxis protein